MTKTHKNPALAAVSTVLGAVLVASSSAFAAPQEEESPAQVPVAKQLFLDNCATCHGENGDGQGTTELDRPARSFKDGGFSYGNTPEALFRTISVGIPGTPMPGFDSSHTIEQRRALAAFVLELGPEVREVTESETILEVRNRPQVVRGKLPPITDGAVEHPRGLLIGTTDGFTFEYRADDVRLLGVRQGAFVRRSDWTGRGGSALEPLGKVVHVVAGGKPEATFATAAGTALRARLAGTWILEGQVGVAYALEGAAGQRSAMVTESCVAVTRSTATGFERRFRVVEQTEILKLRLQVAGEEVDAFDEGPTHWKIHKRADGLFEGLGLMGTADGTLELSPEAQVSVTTQHFVFTEWNDEVRAEWLKEESR